MNFSSDKFLRRLERIANGHLTPTTLYNLRYGVRHSKGLELTFCDFNCSFQEYLYIKAYDDAKMYYLSSTINHVENFYTPVLCVVQHSYLWGLIKVINVKVFQPSSYDSTAQVPYDKIFINKLRSDFDFFQGNKLITPPDSINSKEPLIAMSKSNLNNVRFVIQFIK